MKVEKPNIILFFVGIIMMVVAVIFVSVCVFSIINWNKFKETALETTAVITDIETRRSGTKKHRKTSHIVHIEYTVDGKTYKNTLGEYNSFMREGGNVNILYDPSNPEHTENDPLMMCVLLSIFTIVFSVGSITLIVREIKNSVLYKRLMNDNVYVMCENWRYEPSNLRVNRVRYYIVKCIYKDYSGRDHVFESGAFNPKKSPFTENQPIKIYIDSEDAPSLYYVPVENR